MNDRIEYRFYYSKNGVAAWWEKDAYWHVALPYTPTQEDRERFPTSYPKGNNGPFYRWTDKEFKTKQEAINSIEG
jgi:hypothetical protein